MLGATSVVAFFLRSRFEDPWMRQVFVEVGMLASVAPLLLLSDWSVPLFRQQIVERISYASYCMYLLHRVVFYVMLEVYQPPDDGLTVAYLGLLGVPVLYVASRRLQLLYDSLWLQRTR